MDIRYPAANLMMEMCMLCCRMCMDPCAFEPHLFSILKAKRPAA